MKILFFGDIVGKIGRQALTKELPGLKDKYKPDLVLANAENLAHGTGLTRSTVAEMQEAGVDYFTSGNHVFDKPVAEEFLDEADCPVIRPANYPDGTSGKGYKVINNLLLVNLMGRVFIDEEFSDPFDKLDEILKEHPEINNVFVDFHAEATSEKQALGWYSDGRVSAVIGTHTHVQTNDDRILTQGTGFISDAGMVGSWDSVIGIKKESSIKYCKEGGPFKVDIPESGEKVVNGVFVEIGEDGKAVKLEKICYTIN